jgi:hypothetical protein
LIEESTPNPMGAKIYLSREKRKRKKKEVFGKGFLNWKISPLSMKYLGFH